MKKRFVSILLTCVLLLTSMSAALAVDEITYPLVSEPLTLQFVAPRPSDYANGYAEMKLIKEYEALTGVHIEWEEIPSASWTEKVKLMLNSSKLPDVIYGGGLEASVANRFGSEGVLLPLNDLIENHTVNLKHWLQERPDLKKLIT